MTDKEGREVDEALEPLFDEATIRKVTRQTNADQRKQVDEALEKQDKLSELGRVLTGSVDYDTADLCDCDGFWHLNEVYLSDIIAQERSNAVREELERAIDYIADHPDYDYLYNRLAELEATHE